MNTKPAETDAQPELSEARTDIETLSEAQAEVISMIAHQLRSPIGSIRLAHQTLLENENNNLTIEQLHLLQQAEKRANRMYQLTLELSRICHPTKQSDEHDLVPQNLERLLDDLVVQQTAAVKAKEITIERNYDEQTQPVPIDEPTLCDAITNLLDNAISYSAPGGTISITTNYTTAFVEIRIADTGVGVPPDKQRLLFKKYNRFDNTGDAHTDGLGLGLYITKKIVTDHHGTISYESSKPQGSIFVIKLPLKI